MKLDLIVGARPNFIKIAPLIEEINNVNLNGLIFEYRLIHTGQHYDKNMSDSFFEQLNIPRPNINLKSGGNTQAQQTSEIMIKYEELLKKSSIDYCLVVGDVNSTMACSIVAKKMNVKVIHVEAGIRSWDLTMPEEINRMITDSITDYFFTTSKTASINLINSGISKDRIFFVGNTMIDTLKKYQNKFKKPAIWYKYNLEDKKYIILTLHRPANVDNEDVLKSLLDKISKFSYGLQIIFPAHPRTAKKLQFMNIDPEKFRIIEPLGYLEFNFLVEKSRAVITDSGGITEETTVMKVPCMTLRENTERPETVDIGTNVLLGKDPKNIELAMKTLVSGNWKTGRIPELWDGKTAKRIVKELIKLRK